MRTKPKEKGTREKYQCACDTYIHRQETNPLYTNANINFSASLPFSFQLTSVWSFLQLHPYHLLPFGTTNDFDCRRQGARHTHTHTSAVCQRKIQRSIVQEKNKKERERLTRKLKKEESGLAMGIWCRGVEKKQDRRTSIALGK